MGAPGVIISAPSSGSGKTSVTLGVLRALSRRGLTVGSAKVGPDFIDPAFHAAASGQSCFNLDGWAMLPATLAGLAARVGDGVDLVVCEGVMGLFDGALTAPGQPDGSTASLALATGWPVVLVLDGRGMIASAAAVLAGFDRLRPGPGLAGVVFNRVRSSRAQAAIEAACRAACPDVALLGFLPPSPALEMKSRHLGLVQACERPDLDAFLEGAAALVETHLDLDSLCALARPARIAAAAPVPVPPLGQRIALAHDAAFAFAYPATLEGWRAAGAEILPFSPLADQGPDPSADAVYLPGGYPELHAGLLAANGGFLGGLRAAAARGAAVFGECGGYMVLGRGIEDETGTRHQMAGLLGLESSFARRRLHLGYRRAVVETAGPLGAAGAIFRGHEFHYATILAEEGTPLFAVSGADGAGLGRCGLCASGTVAGSFVHLIDRDVDSVTLP
nr:cobyrinate a,c-diamide synthase [Magnetospirillum molischianum]